MTELCRRCQCPLIPSASGFHCPRCTGRALLDDVGVDTESELDRRQDVEGRRRLGDYQLGLELGRGAMGVVYRARQAKLGRDVAVKLILASRFAGESSRKRFLAEAELAAHLDHPNIVPIYEVGESPDGPFYVMKLVEGGTLAQKLAAPEMEGVSVGSGDKAFAFTPTAAAGILVRIARAVHHAHQRGVLHRDLKPANVLIDSQGQPHITDFGMARRLEPGATLTEPGAAVGTPAYMAPEQARGEKGVTTAADIWSLGAILYHLLTRRPPFTGENIFEILRQVMQEDPLPPSLARRQQPGIALTQQSAPLDRDLETICLTCLEKDPQRRYPSALALAEDLERWLGHEPIRARPSAPLERLTKWARRHPAIAGLAVLAGALFLTGTAGVTWQWQRAEEHRRSAETAQATTERANSEFLALINRLEHQKAEELFRAGDSSRAVALLARGLRRDPTNRCAAERLMSALAYRPFALPEQEYKSIDSKVLAGWSGPDGPRLVGVYNQVEVRLWEADSLSPPTPRFIRATGSAFPTFSPDGRLAVVAVTNNSVEIRNASDRKIVTGPLRHPGPPKATIQAIRFDRSGQRVLTASSDGTARVWSVPDGRLLIDLPVTRQALRDADLSPDGKWAAILDRNGELTIWDDGGRKFVRETTASAPPRLIRWAHDSRHLATASGARLEWLEATNGRMIRSWTAPEEIYSISCGRDDASVLLQGSTAAFLWDAVSGQLAAEPQLRLASGTQLDLPPERDRFHSVTRNGVVRYNRRRPPVVPIELTHGPTLAAIQFSSDGSKLLSLGTNGTVTLWDARTWQRLGAPVSTGGRVIAVSTDAEAVLVATNEQAWLVATSTGEKIGGTFAEDATILGGAIRPDGKQVVFGKAVRPVTGEGSVGLWDVAQGIRTRSDHSYPYKVNGLIYSPDARRLAVRWGSYVGIIEHDLTVKKNLSHGGFVDSAVFSADSQQLVAIDRGYSAKVWTLSNLVERLTLSHEGAVVVAGFSPDARWIGTIAQVRERQAYVWNGITGQRMGEALTHPGNVMDIAFSPDSRRAATGGDDGTARIWDCATGLPLSEPLKHGATVRRVVFDRDGRLVTAADDGIIRIWPIPEATAVSELWLADLSEALAGAYFSSNESLSVPSWEDTSAVLKAFPAKSATNTAAQWLSRLLKLPAAPAPSRTGSL